MGARVFLRSMADSGWRKRGQSVTLARVRDRYNVGIVRETRTTGDTNVAISISERCACKQVLVPILQALCQHVTSHARVRFTCCHNTVLATVVSQL